MKHPTAVIHPDSILADAIIKGEADGRWVAQTARELNAILPQSRIITCGQTFDGIENRAYYVRDVTLGEDASRIRTRPGMMARIRSAALNVLRANGVQNVSLALYANAVSFDQLLPLGTV